MTHPGEDTFGEYGARGKKGSEEVERLTDSVRYSIASVPCFKDEDGSVGVLGKPRSDGESSGASADDYKVISVGDVSVVDDISFVQVATMVIVVDVAVAAGVGRGIG